MKAGVWRGNGTLEYGDWPEPTLGDDDVIVRVAYCGMCGSDVHIVEGNLPIGPPPQVIGHEVSGVVEEVGCRVRGLDIGTPVACNFYGPCNACPQCRAGQPNLCRRKRFGASGYAELARYRADLVYPVPELRDLTHAALLEPAATCLYAVERSRLRPGETALVLGSGAMGLLTVQLALRLGASRVVVSEPNERKRQVALEVGADDAIDPGVVDVAEYALSVGPRAGFDVVFDAAGNAAATAGAMHALAPGGRLMIVAVHGRDITIPISPFQLYERELSVTSAYATVDTFERTAPLLASMTLQPLITAIEPLSNIDEVYRRQREGGYTKVLVKP